MTISQLKKHAEMLAYDPNKWGAYTRAELTPFALGVLRLIESYEKTFTKEQRESA